MGLKDIPVGKHPPEDINVVIEIPAHSTPIKYEVDKASGVVFVDRFVATCMSYPCNYGYIPQTLGDDGDPLDVLVVTPFPLLAGCVINCRPVGMLAMQDEAGEDTKIIAVPTDKMTALYKHVQQVDDLPELLRDQIVHFFEHYKDLEKGKWVKVQGWHNRDHAKQSIVQSIK